MQPKLIMLQGLPGAGKSTEARQIIKDNEFAVRLSRDSIREMFYFLQKSGWNGEIGFRRHVEPDVVEGQFILARYLLRHGYTVIIDDTNFDKKRINKHRKLAISEGAEFELRTLEVSVDTCIERDKNRSESVGEKVIRDMAKIYGREQ